MATPAPVLAFESHWVNYKRIWRGTAFFTFANPAMFLAAMGLGLGTLVAPIDGIPYKAYIAPGLLAAAAMQVGANDGLWPVMAAIRWQRTYYAQTATPLEPKDAADGHLLFIAFRSLLTTVAFFVVMLAFGTVESPWGVLAPLVAMLCGVAFAAPTMAFSASQKSEGTSFSAYTRFVITPLFLFGGAFFPISQLPAVLRPIAWVTPLWHAVEVCRHLTTGSPDPMADTLHLAVLLAWVVGGVLLSHRVYRQRLAP
jgi:lipooligosaccharide transport system permease protein